MSIIGSIAASSLSKVDSKLAHAHLLRSRHGKGEGEWSASLPGRFTPRERNPGTLWIRGWGGTEPKNTG